MLNYITNYISHNEIYGTFKGAYEIKMFKKFNILIFNVEKQRKYYRKSPYKSVPNEEPKFTINCVDYTLFSCVF